MTLYVLDTNTVSQLTRAHPLVSRRVSTTPMESLCLSSITQAEMVFGLAKRPDAHRLHSVVRELLLRIEVLPWTSAAADAYGPLRADLQSRGIGLSALDMLIAAHAMSADAVLVTHDAAFKSVPGLAVDDWEAS